MQVDHLLQMKHLMPGTVRVQRLPGAGADLLVSLGKPLGPLSPAAGAESQNQCASQPAALKAALEAKLLQHQRQQHKQPACSAVLRDATADHLQHTPPQTSPCKAPCSSIPLAPISPYRGTPSTATPLVAGTPLAQSSIPFLSVKTPASTACRKVLAATPRGPAQLWPGKCWPADTSSRAAGQGQRDRAAAPPQAPRQQWAAAYIPQRPAGANRHSCPCHQHAQPSAGNAISWVSCSLCQPYATYMSCYAAVQWHIEQAQASHGVMKQLLSCAELEVLQEVQRQDTIQAVRQSKEAVHLRAEAHHAALMPRTFDSLRTLFGNTGPCTKPLPQVQSCLPPGMSFSCLKVQCA